MSAVSGYSSFSSEEVSKQIKVWNKWPFSDFLSLTVRKSFAHASVKKAFAIGSLSNDDGDGNENCKKAIGLDWRNNNFARAHHASWYISWPSLHGYNVKVPYFTFCRGREHKTTSFLYFS